VTSEYIKEQVEILRPRYQARENRLREAIGLKPLAAAEAEDAAAAAGTIDAVIAKAKDDPAVKQRLIEALLQ